MTDRGMQSVSTGLAVARTFEPGANAWVTGQVPLPVRYKWGKSVTADDSDPNTNTPSTEDLVPAGATGGKVAVYADRAVTVTVWAAVDADWVKTGSKAIDAFEEAVFDTGYRKLFIQVTGVSGQTTVRVAVIG